MGPDSGFGWFCHWTTTHHALSVPGLDLSENVLARACELGHDPIITYARQDMETLDLPAGAFDLTYSSLVLHYTRDLGTRLAILHASLVPGGYFVFSTGHPIYTAPSHPDWIQGRKGTRVWPLNDYQLEDPRTTDWPAFGVIKQHRTLGNLPNLLIGTGFAITHVAEWSPRDQGLAAHPDWAPERDRPAFLLVAARRQAMPAS
ncbi:class I SAM-dependent DNA methyltransferase [Komagataeibacter medellinensis]|uniref:class I SAM-dependent DNA methyltransferase n=1 Tax=Komagataeibacter medellinensis TaxID=1177712 RepID=UPI001E6496E4|nr:class I SAM-dependent methyltransferase [Komagataeibacter medellinensis]